MAFLGSFFKAALRGTSAASSDDEITSSSSPASGAASAAPRGGGKRGGGKTTSAASPAVLPKPTAALNRLLDGFDFADAELIVGPDEVRFPVHAAVVAMSSPLLKRLLFDDSGNQKAVEVSLPDADAECFASVLRFCYTDEWGGNATLVLRLRRLAAALEMEALSRELTRVVEEDLQASDAVGVMQAASDEGDKDLARIALEAALSDPVAAVESPHLKFLRADALGSLVARDDLAAPEHSIVQACFQWAAFQAAKKYGLHPPHEVLALHTGDELAPPVPAGDGEEEAPRVPDAVAVASLVRRRRFQVGAASGEQLRSMLEPHVLKHLRFPQLTAKELGAEVYPCGVLTPREFLELMQYQFKTSREKKRISAVAGYATGKRAGVTRTVLLHLWGGGGASGQDGSGSGYGGCGGYLCVRYEVEPGDEVLYLHVGEGGYNDATGSTSSLSTQAYPNGGRGSYSWNSGGGGGATYVTSSLHKDVVIAGAGGGGGGTARNSWACGGGGGGGTKAGKVGSGGDCGNQPAPEGKAGADGNGRGGDGESRGAGKSGTNNNGAGGGTGTSTKACGGDGGEASWRFSEKVRQIDGKNDTPINVTIGGVKHSAGGGGASATAKDRGKDGLIVIEEEDTGAVHKFAFKGKKAIEFRLS
jgi:hypothetical protein